MPKVKIMRSPANAWYRHRIGEVINVVEHGGNRYLLAEDAKEYAEGKIIWVEVRQIAKSNTVRYDDQEITCATCYFYEEVDNKPDPGLLPYGHCRRFPPSVYDEDVLAHCPPVVRPNLDWCGEHKPKEPL